MGFSNRPKNTTFQFANDDHTILQYGSDFIVRCKLTKLFLAEHALRELTQREETLHHKAIVLQKAMAIESNGAQLEKADKQLEEAQAQYSRKEYALYRAISVLRLELKDAYHSVRRDSRWFMREEMVQDCSDRGGCCSRGCGCCEQRHLSKRKKGIGHCTIECWCCIGFRGFELPEEEKEEISKDFETRVKQWDSGYAIHMANCFFCPLERQALSKPESQWQKILRGFTRKDS